MASPHSHHERDWMGKTAKWAWVMDEKAVLKWEILLVE